MKERIKRLPPEQLKQIRDYVALTMQSATNTSRNPGKTSAAQGRDEAMWFDSSQQELGKVTGSSSSTSFVAPTLTTTLRKSFEIVSDFIEKEGIRQNESYARKAVYNLLAGLLVQHANGLARHLKIPLTLKLVLQNADKLPGIVDLAYPGYLQAGLLPLVIKQHLKSQPKE